VIRLGGTDERPTLRLQGVGSREAVDAIRGQDLLVERQAAPPLGEDEWYAEDLAGCTVVDGDREVGVVGRMLAYPSCELLEVERSDRPTILVPLIADAVRSVDISARLIDVDTGFLGLED
jgi:16S rRNA processing protein RimM